MERIILAGAALDTGNLGVSALSTSIISELSARGFQVTVLDNGRGRRESPLLVDAEHWVDIELRGAWFSRRYWRRESLRTLQSVAGYPWQSLHPEANIWRDAYALLDISGGDSFSDIYGQPRFRSILAPKVIARAMNLPLVLLPQTYGPFNDPALRREAVDAILSAEQVWARDGHSFERLKSLLGDDWDSSRHKRGVDVAFALPRIPFVSNDDLSGWLATDGPTIGVNVSGLIATSKTSRFGLTGSEYLGAISAFVRESLSRGYKVLLVPHVIGEADEADTGACHRIVESTEARLNSLRVAEGIRSAGQVKDVISRLAWFTGGRMHSVIAAMSSGTPVLATAYSDKFAGILADCEIEQALCDLRRVSAEELVEQLLSGLESREETRQILATSVPRVRELARAQFDEVISAIGSR